MTSPIDQPETDILWNVAGQLNYWANNLNVLQQSLTNGRIDDLHRHFKHLAKEVQKHCDDLEGHIGAFGPTETRRGREELEKANLLITAHPPRAQRLWQELWPPLRPWIDRNVADDGVGGIDRFDPEGNNTVARDAVQAFDRLIRDKPARAPRLWEQVRKDLIPWFEEAIKADESEEEGEASEPPKKELPEEPRQEIASEPRKLPKRGIPGETGLPPWERQVLTREPEPWTLKSHQQRVAVRERLIELGLFDRPTGESLTSIELANEWDLLGGDVIFDEDFSLD